MNTYQFLKEHTRENLRFSFFLSVLLYLVGYLVLLPLAGIVLGMVFGFSFDDFVKIVSGDFSIHAQAENIYRSIQGINQLVTWGFVGFVMTHLLGTFKEVMGLKTKIPAMSVILAILLLLLSFPLVQFFRVDFSLFSGMGNWVDEILVQEAQGQKTLELLLANPSISTLIFNLFIFALMPAICEEIFFRGFLQKQFYKIFNPHIAIIVTAFIFSLIHFELPGLISRMVLAILLGYFFYSTKSLIPCILAHFFYNGVSIFLTYINGGIKVDGNLAGQGFPLLISLLSLVIVGGLLYFYVQRFTISPSSSQTFHE